MYVTIEANNKNYFVYIDNVLDNTTNFFKLVSSPINVGIDTSCDIVFENAYIFNNYLCLSFDQNGWNIQIADNAMVYVNDGRMLSNFKRLNFGDVIFIFGLRIVLLNGIVAINNPFGNLKINGDKLVSTSLKANFNFDEVVDKSDDIKELDYYKEDSYFYKKARMRRFIETYDFEVTPPPAKGAKQDTPMILVLGPMLTMGLVSVMSFLNIISII